MAANKQQYAEEPGHLLDLVSQIGKNPQPFNIRGAVLMLPLAEDDIHDVKWLERIAAALNGTMPNIAGCIFMYHPSIAHHFSKPFLDCRKPAQKNRLDGQGKLLDFKAGQGSS